MNQEKKRILELVQNGKLSAQEAIILLEALEEEAPKQTAETNQEQGEEKQTSDAKEDSNTNDNTATDETSKDDTNKKQETSSSSESIYTQLEHAGERLFDFVQNAFNKIKDIDFQFNQSVEIPHTFQQSASEAEKIDIDIANGPVKIKSWDQPEIRVECNAKVYRTDDREEARNYFLDHTVFNYENGLLVFGTQSKWMKVETILYIPKKTYNKISIRAFNGGVKGEQVHSDTLVVKTTNGKVELSNIQGESLDIDTVNGQIKLVDSTIEKVEAETVNGSIQVTGGYDDVELQSLNGNIDCKLLKLVPRNLGAKTITGNIDLTIPKDAGVDGEVRSNIGNYRLQLNDINIMHEKQEIIQKQVKFKRAGVNESILQLVADTKTGSVHVSETESEGQ
ncbi:DUF4097 family beta strand repeat-containing protein [Bacillus niameyensis]|uniref:DUF4097 family beta strand repeat-containing protein n=1 Tax=Bacillus niameyensis TaxID=1522308 RepID=UPI000784DC63|nr:DUF4097 domain-containing protein [Bacillus niameyensis]